MHQNRSRAYVPPLLILLATVFIIPSARAQQACFSAEERARAERSARGYQGPAPGYDPERGYNPANGPRRGARPVDENGLAKPINCLENEDESPSAGTTPKFHCSVQRVTNEDGELVRCKVKPHYKGQSR